MRILYGTTNGAKLQAMRRAVEPIGIEIVGLRDMQGEIPKVQECGRTPLDNAEIKAKAYYKAFRMPVFSCDSGLYFRELREEEQPGIYVRRVNGEELTDEAMIAHYASLAAQHGGRMTGQYRNGIYFVLDDQHHFSSMDLSIATEPFLLTSVPHPKRVQGFPIDALSVDIASGQYYYDMEEQELAASVDAGIRAFFCGCLGIRR